MWKCSIPEGKSGKWSIKRFSVNERNASISAFFDGKRKVPSGSYTKLVYEGGCFNDVVMSDTPAEYKDHRWIIRNAKGKVLIAGLGLGLVLEQVAGKDEVISITIIESSADVIKLVWEHIPEQIKAKCTLIHGDIYDLHNIDKSLHFDYAWFDIWPTICGDNTSDFGKLKTKYRNRVDIMGFWAEKECKQENKRRRR